MSAEDRIRAALALHRQFPARVEAQLVKVVTKRKRSNRDYMREYMRQRRAGIAKPVVDMATLAPLPPRPLLPKADQVARDLERAEKHRAYMRAYARARRLLELEAHRTLPFLSDAARKLWVKKRLSAKLHNQTQGDIP